MRKNNSGLVSNDIVGRLTEHMSAAQNGCDYTRLSKLARGRDSSVYQTILNTRKTSYNKRLANNSPINGSPCNLVAQRWLRISTIAPYDRWPSVHRSINMTRGEWMETVYRRPHPSLDCHTQPTLPQLPSLNLHSQPLHQLL